MTPVLILGGTTEGRRLAEALAFEPGGLAVINSLAGRTGAPLRPPGEVRIGGFGGVPGLVAFLRSRRIAAIVDATHPFAAVMTGNAVAAAAETGVPLLVLRRPGWVEGPGDDWRRVPSIAAAATVVPEIADRVFLTTGRQTVGAFAALDGCWFLSRSVEPPTPPMPAHLSVILDRGPFTPEGELQLLREHRIGVLVTKDSGGDAPKLAAARELSVPVVMVERPPTPGTVTVSTVAEATAWLRKVATR